MPSEKLASLLQTFSRYELNRFRKFLLSPYLNDQEDLTRLFDILDNMLRKDAGALAHVDKKVVWKTLYPQKQYDDAHLRRLASDLTQSALRFLVEEARKQDPLGEALELQKVLEKPGLQKHLSGVERQIRKYLETNTGQSTWYYLSQFRSHWNQYNRASKVMSTAEFMELLWPADQSLEHFYVVQKLKFYVAWLTFRGFRSTEQEIAIIDGFWEYIKDEKFNDIPLISIYRDVILCLMHPDDESFYKALMTNLGNNARHLTAEDRRECYHIAQNYCAFKINQGKTDYYQEMFGIFTTTIKLGILLEEGQLAEGVFKNIITVGLRLGEFKWVEHFIDQYAGFLPLRIRDNARTFNLANLYSHQKKHDKVIDLLRNVEYSDIVYSLGAKLILVRTYYELKEYVALDSLIDSFRIYIRRNKLVSKSQKREYNNFLNFVKKLVSLDVYDTKMIEKLKERVMEASNATPKKWLLEKIAELESGSRK
jgi:hypothetical protein